MEVSCPQVAARRAEAHRPTAGRFATGGRSGTRPCAAADAGRNPAVEQQGSAGPRLVRAARRCAGFLRRLTPAIRALVPAMSASCAGRSSSSHRATPARCSATPSKRRPGRFATSRGRRDGPSSLPPPDTTVVEERKSRSAVRSRFPHRSRVQRNFCEVEWRFANHSHTACDLRGWNHTPVTAPDLQLRTVTPVPEIGC